ncbi:MAG: peptide chain release factor N(5)-glutamine methyltransferase [Spirochaetia bacterium]|nr:peptide chain release factor N(5)-glutamine methyltransferase [Spirochaetia bacterium]
MSDTITQLRQHIIAELTKAGVSNADLETEILLREVTGKDSARLLVDRREVLSDEKSKLLKTMTAKRSKRIPLAHVLGYTEFYGHKFITRPGVLIPRKETEILIEKVLGENIPMGATVLDLACGSGCIGLTVARERPDLMVHLSDISEEALAQTRENAQNLAISNVQVYQSDWFTSLPAQHYYAILTNPPYIHQDEALQMEPEVLDHDPHIALFHKNPLELYKQILRESQWRLTVPGFIAAELSPFIARDVLAFAAGIYASASLVQDYSRHDRILFARTK